MEVADELADRAGFHGGAVIAAGKRAILCGLHMFHNQLSPAAAAEVADAEPVAAVHPGRQRSDVVEGDGIDGIAALRMAQRQAQVRILQHALVQHAERVIEHWFGESLAPGPGKMQLLGQFHRHLPGSQRSVAPQHAVRVHAGQHPGEFGLPGGGEGWQLGRRQAQPGCHGMPAEAQAGGHVAGGHRGQDVTHMHAIHRTGRALERAGFPAPIAATMQSAPALMKASVYAPEVVRSQPAM